MEYLDSDITFRANWARRQIYKSIARDYQDSDQGPVAGPGGFLGDQITPEHLPPIKARKGEETVLRPEVPYKIGIVGAGAAGLFAGLIIDYLKDQIPDINLEYEILEATDGKRVGGRLFTYDFPPILGISAPDHQYYDVGAMRFPDNPVMARTFKLFDFLDMKKTPNPPAEPPRGCLIPYYYQGLNTPWLFNNIQFIGADPWGQNENTFNLTGDIPEVTKDPETVLDSVIDEFKILLKEDIDKKLPEGPGWQKLMRADKYSTRDYLLWWEKIKREDQHVLGTTSEPTPPVPEPDGFSFDTVQWIETFNGGTHWYNQSFSETVLEAMDFNYPKASWTAKEVEKNIWWCVQGGASEIAKRMTDKVVNKPKYSQRVARISETDPTNPRQSKLAIDLQDGSRQGVYDAVMNSTTLGAMQHMDLTKIHLNYGTKQAIRTLNYGASCKVGIQFKNAWWITKSRVTEGGLGRTDLPIRTCVYPSYNLHDDHDAPAVLLCTYTWESDAERMGSMISRHTPGATVEQDYLKPLLIDNLARLHSDPSKEGDYEAMYEIINESYHTHHAYNWFTDPEAVGAFAFFGPGQFSDMWPDIIKPSAYGKLIVIGEHASAHHAWVVGALESAVRGVWQILDMHGDKISSAGKARRLLEKDSKLPFGPLPLEFQPRPLQYLNIMSQTGVGRK